MSWGWDTSSNNGYRDADEYVSDEKLIETLKQAGNWHCDEAAKRLHQKINQAESDHCKIELLKQDVKDSTDPAFLDRLENFYKVENARLSMALLNATNQINALKDALAQVGTEGFEP